MELSNDNINRIIKAIGIEIAQKRDKLGISQNELSKSMGMSVNTISNIERGEHPGHIDNIIKLCYYLDISIDPLITGIKEYDMPIFSGEFSKYKCSFEKLSPQLKRVVLKTTMTLVDELANYDERK